MKYADQSFPLKTAKTLVPGATASDHTTISKNDVDLGFLQYKPSPPSRNTHEDGHVFERVQHCMLPFLGLGMFHGQKLMLPLQFLSSMLITLHLGTNDCFGRSKDDKWKIKNVRLLCDVVQVDPAISAELATKLSSGVPLNIPINTWNVYTQALTGQMDDVTIQVSRALSKLKQSTRAS